MQRTRQFLALLLVTALALGGLPAPMTQAPALLAAPAAQADASVLVGQYRSEILPAADSPGLLVTLLLYDDGSAAVLSDYLNDTAPIVEIGDWVENDDGSITLTVVGTTEMDYAQPVSLTFIVDEDGALVVPGTLDGPFGEIGLRLAPVGLSSPDFSDLPADALVYQSALLPAASGPGLQITLVLFSDGSLAMVSDYLQPGEYVVEVGTWHMDDDGTLRLTLTGQADREYNQPVDLEFTVGEDDALQLVDEDGLLFGDEGLRLEPVRFAAAAEPPPGEPTDEEPLEEQPTDDAESAAEEEPSAEAATDEATDSEAEADDSDEAAALVERGAGTAYSSLLLPTDDGFGVFVIAVLYENGDALFSTYHLNGDLPVIEVAAWEVVEEDTLSISFLGTLDGDYDAPIIVEAQVADGDVLLLEDVALYPLRDLGPQTETVAEEETVTLLAQFVSAETPAALAPSLAITLNLYADLSAELISDDGDEQVVTQVGAWEAGDDETLTLTLTGQADQVYDTPLVMVFAVGDDDSLTLISDEEGSLFGEGGLVLYAVELETAEESVGAEEELRAELATMELFQSAVLPSASSPGLRLTLGLAEDGRAILAYDYLAPGEVVINYGTWEENNDGSITVTLDEGPSGPFADPDVLTLARDDDGNLVVVEVSETVPGLLDVILSPATLEE